MKLLTPFRKRGVAVTTALSLITLAAVVWVFHGASAQALTAGLTSTQDTFVSSSNPGTNYGTANPIFISNSTNNSLLKFDTSSIPAGVTVTSAKIVANQTVSGLTTGGIRAHPASTTWSETTVTYSNQPAVNTAILGTSPLPGVGRVEIPLAVTAVTPGQAVTSFRLSYSASGIVAKINSRESGANAPRLEVTYTTNTPTPTATPTSADPVIVGAGDIACDPASSSFNSGNGSSSSCRQKYTSDLVVSNPDVKAVLPLGDNQYYCGGLSAFQTSYDLSWGRFKNITHPVVGNHEYIASAAAGTPATGCDATGAGSGHYDYYGASAGTRGQGFYSYDVGAWHLIALNTNCSKAGGCGAGSPQYNWLQADLAAHSNNCTLAYFHHPLFSQDTSGGKASTVGLPFYQLLYNAGADVVLAGHSHNYQRFAALKPDGTADSARGLVEFVVGTGGANHTSIDPAITPMPLVANTTTFGVLQLTLHSGSYDWKFIPEAGYSFTDSGNLSCH